ncbi:hypothetical protein L3V86_07470 [Thiotrichales bacterium 19S11-10]|nr:hypothetical protein [Thiotrichales bacterium 19S11-10]MCF6808394.1 hypothetical protein [Thiotrichales bacterium 19S9-11]MCF6812364.1 hypothetical protein [Thiotrichales bacterium 19S9-12]
MKYYKLLPREEILNDVLWRANSSYYEPIIIEASNEIEARKIAEMHCSISYGESLKTSGLWLDNAYVKAIEIDLYHFNILRKQLRSFHQETSVSVGHEHLH